jgi:hypothetical protein
VTNSLYVIYLANQNEKKGNRFRANAMSSLDASRQRKTNETRPAQPTYKIQSTAPYAIVGFNANTTLGHFPFA